MYAGAGMKAEAAEIASFEKIHRSSGAR